MDVPHARSLTNLPLVFSLGVPGASPGSVLGSSQRGYQAVSGRVQAFRQGLPVCQEHAMTRPDLATRACGPPACPPGRRPGATKRTGRQVSGPAPMHRRRWRPCGEACAARRGRA
jgi:hypothetical protein